jgi:Reverse transcriptase (RNA-dependent DNA polymerase)
LTLRNSTFPKSMWQQLAGFSSNKPQTKVASEIKEIPLGENNNVNGQANVITDQTQDEVIVDVSDDRSIDQSVQSQTMDDVSVVASVGEDENSVAPGPQVKTTRVGRVSKAPFWHKDYYVALTAVLSDFWYEEPYSYAASSDPDVLYLKDAMKADDSEQFVKAMQDEVQAHVQNNNWILVHKSKVPANRKILPAVWVFRRKRDIATRIVKKWKARLNLHGGKQVKGLDYWETYAPVALWPSIRLIMYAAVLNNWTTRQVDFVQAFPQAPVETDIYMKIPQGFHVSGGTKDHCLKLLNNLYGQKQAGRVWNNFLTNGLK